MNTLKKFTNQTGQIVRHYEMFIPKSGAAIKTEYHEFPILLSHDNNIVIFNNYKKFQLLDVKKKRHDDRNYVLSNVHTYVRNWGSCLLEYNGLVSSIYTLQSEKIAKKRVHEALKKLIIREYGAYTGMLDRIETFLTKINC